MATQGDFVWILYSYDASGNRDEEYVHATEEGAEKALKAKDVYPGGSTWWAITRTVLAE